MPDTETPRPREPVTDDLILRVDAALDKTQGHRGHAAILLGIETKRLNNIIGWTPPLRAKWGKHDREIPDSSDASEIHRDASIPPFTPEELALVEAQTAENKVWERGMQRLNFTPEKHEFLAAVMENHGTHWKHMAQMFQGGVSYTATELLFQFNKINSTIADTYDHPEKYDRKMENQWGVYVTKTAHEVRMELTDRALSIAEMFRKLNADSERALLITAQVEKLKVEHAEDVKRKKKSGWSKPASPDGP
jgi:hypothetical protein